jgi:succinate-semialdehyde dehydrogenase/glutarate-semialdehyde dehydrogenase
MADYAVINPATGETVKEYETISDDGLRGAIASAFAASQEWVPTTTVDERAQMIRRVGELHTERRRQLAETGARRGRLLHGDL